MNYYTVRIESDETKEVYQFNLESCSIKLLYKKILELFKNYGPIYVVGGQRGCISQNKKCPNIDIGKEIISDVSLREAFLAFPKLLLLRFIPCPKLIVPIKKNPQDSTLTVKRKNRTSKFTRSKKSKQNSIKLEILNQKLFFDAQIENVSLRKECKILEPNQLFIKIWQVKNTGLFPWPENLKLVAEQKNSVFSNVDIRTIKLERRVNPGDKFNFVVTLYAPKKEGIYKEIWKLAWGANLTKFGPPFIIKIKVISFLVQKIKEKENELIKFLNL